MMESNEIQQKTALIFNSTTRFLNRALRDNIEKIIYRILPECKSEHLIVSDRDKKERFIQLLDRMERQISSNIFDLFIPKIVFETDKSHYGEIIIMLAFLDALYEYLMKIRDKWGER